MEIQNIGKVLAAVIVAMLVITLGVVVAMLVAGHHSSTVTLPAAPAVYTAAWDAGR